MKQIHLRPQVWTRSPFVFAVLAVMTLLHGPQPLAQGGAVLEEIIVNARRIAESAQDVPIAITAFGEAEIEVMAPNTLRDFDGNPHHLSEYIGNGKWTVVAIWENDCPICNAEIQTMEFFHLDRKDKDATVLGV